MSYRAYVKIPTLHPDEPNALMYLDDEELDKLAGRVEKAKANIRRDIREDKQKERTLLPGTKVRDRHGFSTLKPGAHGVVVSWSMVALSEPIPGAVPVAWEGVGLLYTPIRFIERVS